MECDQNTVVHPPNKGFERKIELSITPKLYNHLLFLDFNGKGKIVFKLSQPYIFLYRRIDFGFL